MNIDDFKNIEDDLVPNAPLKLPFEIIRVCVNKDKITNSIKNQPKFEIKYLWWCLLFFIIIFIIIDGGFILFISLISFALMIYLYSFSDLYLLNEIREDLENADSWVDKYSFLTFTNTELIFRNPLNEIVKIIKIDDIVGFYCYSSVGKNSQWVYVEYGNVGKKESYEYIQPFIDCFYTYIELVGDKYLIDNPKYTNNASIVNIYHQIINALKENPSATEISFNKSYYINWR